MAKSGDVVTMKLSRDGKDFEVNALVLRSHIEKHGDSEVENLSVAYVDPEIAAHTLGGNLKNAITIAHTVKPHAAGGARGFVVNPPEPE